MMSRMFAAAAIASALLLWGCNKKAEQAAGQNQTGEKKVEVGAGLKLEKLSKARFVEGIRTRTDSLTASDTLYPGARATTYSVHYEQIIDTNVALVGEINRLLKRAVLGEDESIDSEAESLFVRNKEFSDSEFFQAYEGSMESNLISVSDSFVVYQVRFEAYEGGAHPIYGTSAKVLRVGDLSRPCALKEIFSGAEVELMTRSLRDSLKNRQEELDVVADTVSLPEDFFFDGKGVSFRFPPYSVGAGALGELEIHLPYLGLK